MSGTLRSMVLLALVVAGTTPARAVDLARFDTQTPEVSFDVPPRLACTDVTTAEFLRVHPAERLVRVEAPVSLLLYHGEADRIQDVVVEIDGAPAGLRVVDYAPRTELASEHSEPIEVKETRAVDKSLGASLGGHLAGDVAITPTLSGGLSKTESETEKHSLLAPKKAVVVSGTTNDRRAAFFKLKRTNQSTLEGERTFVVTFARPADWPGGAIEVRCLARGRQKWLLVEQRRVWNETTRPVELRLVSHNVAKPAAGYDSDSATLPAEDACTESRSGDTQQGD